jgi:hypothetical protein
VADRNRSIQLVVDEFTDGRIAIQGHEDDWYEYWLHWNALTRVKEVDDKTGEIKRKVWVRNGEDHYALATVYWRVGMMRFGSNDSKLIMKETKIPEAPVVYPNQTIDAKFALDKYQKKPDRDWRKI